MRTLRPLALLLALLVLLPLSARAGDDILSTYRKRYQSDGFLSDKEAIIDELAATKDVKAVDALEWCAEESARGLEEAEKDADKAYKKWKPVFDKLVEKETNYIEQLKKRGLPIPKTRPRFPEDDKIAPLQTDLKRAEKRVADERNLLVRLLDATGVLVANLVSGEQSAVETRWKEKVLVDRDWNVRARGYELLGHTPTDWAVQALLAGAVAEADPRVLAKVLLGLGGRKVELVLPVFRERLADPRWLVRAAVVEALLHTPSKETIDLLIETLAREEGRLQDDCAAALRTLTGADIRSDADLWHRYWEANREGWNGPPKVKEENPLDPNAPPPEAKGPAAGSTGFFGIETKSRRIVYVIDVSGSMNEESGPAGSPTRAHLAKEELKRAVLALEDGATFNIVFFSVDVKPWKKEMVDADSKSRREAVDFIEKVEVVGGTSTYDALEFAFDLATVGKGKSAEPDPSGDAKVDTVILLSDGKPSLGRYTDGEKIREQVRAWNVDRRIQVHTVAFGADADTGFMEGLAKDTGGSFLSKK